MAATITLFSPGFKKEITFPHSWQDLIPAEVLTVCHLLAKEVHMQEEIFTALLDSRMQAIGLSPRRRKDIFMHLSPQDAAGALPLIDFITTDPPIIAKPVIRKELIAHDFDKLLVAEFEDLSPYLKEAMTDLRAAATVAAILYRRPGIPYLSFDYKKNDYVPYDHRHQEDNFLRKVKPEVLRAISLWCIGNMHLMKTIFDPVFSGAGGEEDPLAFTKCIHAAAGPKNGTRAQVRATPLYEFLFEMQQESIKAKELDNLTT